MMHQVYLSEISLLKTVKGDYKYLDLSAFQVIKDSIISEGYDGLIITAISVSE
jgi:hypothetical protein